MKKLFSLFTAILFAGTIIAGEVVFSGADFTGGTANTGSAFSVTKNGVTVSSDKAYGTGEELRVYAGGKLTVTATDKITNISAEFGQNTKKKFDPVTPNAKSWSITADKQIRIAELTVVINGEGGGESGEGGEGGEGGESGEGGDVTPSGDVLTCAEAAAIAKNDDGKTYTAKGYVTEIAYALKNGSMSFWMADTQNGGKVLEAYKCAVANEADAPKVGDLVQVTGKLTTFKSTSEFAEGCTCVIIQKGEGGESGEGGDITPSGDILTCTEAAAIAKNDDGKTYTAQGYVTEIAYALKNGSMSFWMADTQNGGKVLEAYKCAVANEADAPKVGDLVQVTGKLTTFKSTSEFAEGCTCVIIQKGEGGESGEGEGTGDDAINIDVAFAEATLFSDESGDYWQVNLFKSYDEETDVITYPDFYVLFTAKSNKAIAGTYPASDLEIYLDTDEETEIEQTSSSDLKITLVSGTTYRYQLTFVGDDDNNYKLDVTLETDAYDGTNNYAEIILDETPEEGSAVENTTLNAKPVKTIQNGMLIIEHNGIQYNVLGTQIK